MSSSVMSIALWQKRVAELLPNMSKSQAAVLGLISYGMVILDGCGMTRLSNGLGQIEQVPAGRLRQRLREFYYEAEAKRGKKRREVDVQKCFGDLLRGVLRGWEGKKELALALDASTLGERFTVLNISVMYRGCGIPVTWKIIPAMEEGEWRTYWEGMLETLAASRAAGLEGDRDGRPRTLCRLALSSDSTTGVASNVTRQRASEFSHTERRELQPNGYADTTAWSGMGGSGRME